MLGWSIVVMLSAQPILFSKTALGKNAGVIGPIYPILEEDGIEVFKREAAKINPEEVKKKMLTDISKQAEVHLPIPHTTTPSDQMIVPRAVLQRDLAGQNGQLIAAKGLVFNPLEKNIYQRSYLIIDGTDEKQIAWLHRKLSEKRPIPAKTLVTNGNVYTLSKTLNKLLYPASQEILDALHVVSVPTEVILEGKQLHVKAERP